MKKRRKKRYKRREEKGVWKKRGRGQAGKQEDGNQEN